MTNDRPHPGPDAPFEPLYSLKRTSAFERALGAFIFSVVSMVVFVGAPIAIADLGAKERVHPFSSMPVMLLVILSVIAVTGWISFLRAEDRWPLPMAVYRADGVIYVRILSGSPAAQTIAAFYFSCFAAAILTAILWTSLGSVSFLTEVILLAICLVITTGYYFDYRNEIAKGNYDLIIRPTENKLSIPYSLGGPIKAALTDVIELKLSSFFPSDQDDAAESHKITLRVSVPPHGVIGECRLFTLDNLQDAEYVQTELKRLLEPQR